MWAKSAALKEDGERRGSVQPADATSHRPNTPTCAHGACATLDRLITETDYETALANPAVPEDVELLLSYRQKRKAAVAQMASVSNPDGQRESAPAKEAA